MVIGEDSTVSGRENSAALGFASSISNPNPNTKIEMILRHTRYQISLSTAKNPQAINEDKSESEEEDNGYTTTSPNPSSIALRLNTLPSTPSLAAAIGIHSATVAGCTSFHHGERARPASLTVYCHQPGRWSLEEGGWISEVSVTPGGRLVSKKSLGFGCVTCGGGGGTDSGSSNGVWYDGMRTGVRLVVIWQLNWNTLGLLRGGVVI